MLKTQRELDVIKGKIVAGAATPEEIEAHLDYVETLETLREQAQSEFPDRLAEWCEYANVTAEQLAVRPAVEQADAHFAYVTALEKVLDEADMEDFFGTEGWRHRIGTED